MSKKALAFIVVVVLGGGWWFGRQGGQAPAAATQRAQAPGDNGAASGSSPSASPTPPALMWHGRGSSATSVPMPTVTPLPGFGPAADMNALSAAVDGMATPRPMHVHFAGENKAGLLQFDVNTDGDGNLSGTYTSNGDTVNIVVTAGRIYMQGPDTVMEMYTNIPAQQVSSWVQLPDGYNPDVLGTVASARLLHDCMAFMRDDFEDWSQAPDPGVGVSAAAWDKPWGIDWMPWTFGITTSPSRVVAFDFLNAGAGDQPEQCNNGVQYVEGSDGGTRGVFTFSNIGRPIPPIGPPQGSVPYPVSGGDPQG